MRVVLDTNVLVRENPSDTHEAETGSLLPNAGTSIEATTGYITSSRTKTRFSALADGCPAKSEEMIVEKGPT